MKMREQERSRERKLTPVKMSVRCGFAAEKLSMNQQIFSLNQMSQSVSVSQLTDIVCLRN